MQPPDSVQYNGIHFLPTVVACYKNHQLINSTSREDIQGVSVRHTWLADHAVLWLCFGALNIYLILDRFYEWFTRSRALNSSIIITLLLTAFIEFLFIDNLKRGPVLVLQLRRKRVQIPFSGKPDIEELRRLLEGAKAMGYPVDVSSVDALPKPR